MRVSVRRCISPMAICVLMVLPLAACSGGTHATPDVQRSASANYESPADRVREQNAWVASQIAAYRNPPGYSMPKTAFGRKPLSLGDSWEQSPYYAPPPSTFCLLHSNHDALASSFPTSGTPTPINYDCWIATFDTINVPRFTSTPCGYNPNCPMIGPGNACQPTSWVADYEYGSSADASLTQSVSPTMTGQGNPDCTRPDDVLLTIQRVALPPNRFTMIGARGSYTYCWYSSCAGPGWEANVIASMSPYPPPPPCVAFSAETYQYATQYGIRPTLMAAIGAEETGHPPTDDGRNIYQEGWPVTHGVGVWQIDVGQNPDYTGGLNVALQADWTAKNLAKLIAKWGETGAVNSWNAGSPTNASTPELWNDGWQSYVVGVQRHEQRIIDYKAVCPNGHRG